MGQADIYLAAKAAERFGGEVMSPITAPAGKSDPNAEFDRRHADGDRMLKEVEQIEKQLDAERQLAEVRDDKRPAGREDVSGRGAGTADADKDQHDKEYRSTFRRWMADGVTGLSAE